MATAKVTGKGASGRSGAKEGQGQESAGDGEEIPNVIGSLQVGAK